MTSTFRTLLRLLLAASALITTVAAQADETIKIAVTAGPHAQIAEVAKKVATRDGLTLQIVEFQDYVQPNAALDAGDVPANSYQNLPFLQSQIQARGCKITAVGDTVTFPMGSYSKRYKSLAELPKGSKVGNYAIQAGLVPTRDAITIEDAKSPYAKLLAVRTADKDRPWVAKLVKAFQSPEVKQFVQSNFAGPTVPAF